MMIHNDVYELKKQNYPLHSYAYPPNKSLLPQKKCEKEKSYIK